MNTQLAHDTMKHVIAMTQGKRPNWIELGRIISRHVTKMEGATPQHIAEQVMSEYRAGSPDME